MLTLIQNGLVYAPLSLGKQALLIDDETIIKVGEVDVGALEKLGIELKVVDARGNIVTPGVLDVHSHLLGGSGEGGFSYQSPMIFFQELVTAGITTVVGVLGVDTTMRTVAGLLGRVKALKEEGLSAYMWTGGYNIPPTTVLQSVRSDIMYIEEIIGAGEVAISDERSLGQSPQALAEVVLDTHIGGLLTGKAGFTHFHVGPKESRLSSLWDLLEQFNIEAAWLYPTHINRSPELVREAVALANKGAYVDTDVADRGLAKVLHEYREAGGPMTRLTISSDSGLTSPSRILEEVRDACLHHGFTFEELLPCFTSNPATALKLTKKGHLAPGKHADVLILDKDSLELVHVFACGNHLLDQGRLRVRDRFLAQSDRRIHMQGALCS